MAETIEQQVANLGSDMIMSAASTTPEQNEQLAATQAAVGNNAGMANLMQFRKTRPIVRDYNIRPNDPCPCGSGKKYKNCCKNTGKYEGYHTV